MKVSASNRLAGSRMHDRFEKEMLAVRSLSHPNIVTAYDAWDVEGIALLVSEWVDGSLDSQGWDLLWDHVA